MIGQTLNNRFTIIARLGKGAMGTVYHATDRQTEREVAVKTIARELAFDPDMLARFKREGEALRQLKHPNIVGFVDAFQHDEQYVIVMEYVAGGSLLDLIKRGPLPVDRAQRITLELCDALTRAHLLNVIHRDIKPENMLVDTDGTPKLTDFGVARLVGEANRLTGTGTQIGTPYYMSPEAWEGKPLDAQSDIWSLGVVLYEMLSGEVPFGGETLVAVMNKVLTAPLPDLKTKRPDVPEGLTQIVHRMLTRDKAGRYRSMRELGADLERGGPATAAPVTVSAPPAADTVPAYAPPTAKIPQEKKGGAAAPSRTIGKLIALGVGGFVVLVLAVVGASILVPRLVGSRTPTSAPGAATGLAATDVTIAQNTPQSQASSIASSGGLSCGTGETLLFSDNFEDGNADSWTFTDAAGATTNDWPIESQDGSNVLVGEGHNWATTGGLTWRNYALSVRVKPSESDAEMIANILLIGGSQRYALNYPGGGVFKQIGNSQFPDVGQVQFPEDNEWHSLRVSAIAGSVEVLLDGQLLGTFEDSDPITGSGQIGLENSSGKFYYDDVLVCQLPEETAAQAPTPSSPEAVQAVLADPWGAAIVQQNQAIPLGVAVDLSGNCITIGPDQRDAAQLAIDDHEPVAGFGITTVVVDATGPDGGAAAAEEILASSPVAIVGTTCSGPMAAALPIFDAAHVVVISPSASRDDLSQQGSEIFNRLVLRDSINPNGDSLADPASAGYQEFAQKFTAKFGRECCTPYAAEAYDAATILLNAIELVAVVNENGELLIPRQALAQAVRATVNYEGVSGTITLDQNGDRVPPP